MWLPDVSARGSLALPFVERGRDEDGQIRTWQQSTPVTYGELKYPRFQASDTSSSAEGALFAIWSSASFDNSTGTLSKGSRPSSSNRIVMTSPMMTRGGIRPYC